MILSRSELQRLRRVATEAARAAGALVEASRPVVVEHKAGADSEAAQVVTDVDHRAEALIVEALPRRVAGSELALLTEEREDDGGRARAPAFWCIDPLDGTLAYTEGTPGYAVSIALVDRDGTPWLGTVFDPVEGTVWSAARGLGLVRDERPWSPPAIEPSAALSVFLDRSFLGWPDHDAIVDGLDDIARGLGRSGARIEATAGAVLNACRVLAHPPAVYFKPPKPRPGGGSLWDYAATACLFHEAGASATDLAGASLDLNRRDSTYLNHRGVLFATDAALADRIRRLPFVPRQPDAR